METVFGWMVGVLVGFAFIWVVKQWLRPACPKCRGRVPMGATRCLHCHEDFAEPLRPSWHKAVENERFSITRVALILLAIVVVPFLIAAFFSF
jgi:ribosomal protein L40E